MQNSSTKPKLVIAGNVRPLAQKMLEPHCEIQQWTGPGAIPRDLLFQWLADANALFSSGSVHVDGELLEHAPKLRVIAQSSVGYDNVDIDACTAKGIPFGNTPGVLVETTADLAFGLLLTSARRIHEGWIQVKSGEWKSSSGIPFGVDLYGKTLGIVGMGQIGVAVAKRAQAFGMRILYNNRTRRQDEAELKATYASFDDLLTESDFVLVLVPLTASSRGLFGREQFAKMKQTSYFINAARGPIIDTDALYEALKDGQIAYAALDVTDPEPLPGDHKLLTLPNILITPHVGSATYETRDRMAELAANNILHGLAGKPLLTCVNESVNYQ